MVHEVDACDELSDFVIEQRQFEPALAVGFGEALAGGHRVGFALMFVVEHQVPKPHEAECGDAFVGAVVEVLDGAGDLLGKVSSIHSRRTALASPSRVSGWAPLPLTSRMDAATNSGESCTTLSRINVPWRPSVRSHSRVPRSRRTQSWSMKPVITERRSASSAGGATGGAPWQESVGVGLSREASWRTWS